MLCYSQLIRSTQILEKGVVGLGLGFFLGLADLGLAVARVIRARVSRTGLESDFTRFLCLFTCLVSLKFYFTRGSPHHPFHGIHH